MANAISPRIGVHACPNGRKDLNPCKSHAVLHYWSSAKKSQVVVDTTAVFNVVNSWSLYTTGNFGLSIDSR
jgi:hypothetical protein